VQNLANSTLIKTINKYIAPNPRHLKMFGAVEEPEDKEGTLCSAAA
jgi:hypothetical protein